VRRLSGRVTTALVGLLAITTVPFVVFGYVTASPDARLVTDGRPHRVLVDTGSERMLFVSSEAWDGSGTSVDCRVRDLRTGEDVGLTSPERVARRSYSRRRYYGVAVFDPGSGELEVTCAAPVESVVRIDGVPSQSLPLLLVAGAIGLSFLVVTGLAVLVVVALRRRPGFRPPPGPGGPPGRASTSP
jgi:hypothetical protein